MCRSAADLNFVRILPPCEKTVDIRRISATMIKIHFCILFLERERSVYHAF